jgi:hypothetical protein
MIAMFLLNKNLPTNFCVTDVSLAAMTGSRIHQMTVQMVYSFCRGWNGATKRLIIVSDGTRTEKQIRKDFSFWKGNLVVADWKDCLSSYSGDLEAFTKFADQSVYGRKFAAMLHYAKEGPLLFCDSDVLWFHPLKSLPNPFDTMIKVCEDIEPSYNLDLVAEMGWHHLEKFPPINVGVVYLNGDLMRRFPVIDEAIKRLRAPFKFPEQTILAAVCQRDDVWPLTEVHITLDDLGKLFTRDADWAARHYVSIAKFKYWRDAARQNLITALQAFKR